MSYGMDRLRKRKVITSDDFSLPSDSESNNNESFSSCERRGGSSESALARRAAAKAAAIYVDSESDTESPFISVAQRKAFFSKESNSMRQQARPPVSAAVAKEEVPSVSNMSEAFLRARLRSFFSGRPNYELGKTADNGNSFFSALAQSLFFKKLAIE
jgi:hypothetical protein